MSWPRTHWFIAVSVPVVLLAAAAWSVNYMEDNRSAAAEASLEADACRQLATQIQRLRNEHHGQTASAARPDLTARITRAAAGAGLAAAALDRIDPDPDRHSAAGNFIESPTRVVIRQATLRQLINFFHALDDSGQGLRVERIHLTTPTEDADDGAWTAEATIVYGISAG